MTGIGRQPTATWLRLSLCPHGLACWPEPGCRLGPLCARVLARELTATCCTRTLCRGSGFGRSDCPLHVIPPRGVLFPMRGHCLNPPAHIGLSCCDAVSGCGLFVNLSNRSCQPYLRIFRIEAGNRAGPKSFPFDQVKLWLGVPAVLGQQVTHKPLLLLGGMPSGPLAVARDGSGKALREVARFAVAHDAAQDAGPLKGQDHVQLERGHIATPR